ncbi:MAG: extracellular solute-binding protein [bacterium]|nr:extracellular solute-binding protein [bacterium]
MNRNRKLLAKLLAVLMSFALVASACGNDDDDAAPTQSGGTDSTPMATEAPEPSEPEATATEAPEPEAPATQAPEPEMEMVDASDAAVASTQFAPPEEQQKILAITADAGSSGLDMTFGEAGQFTDQILAGSGQIDVIGALHGTFPALARDNALSNVADVLDDLSADRSFAPSMVSAGLLGTEDFLAFVPWAQATYIMVAHNNALDYLPDGADIDNLTWDHFAEWCAAIQEGEGEPLCGLPRAGLFHRFLEGYMWPSYTGGMVSQFRSAGAVEMMEYLRDDLAPTLHPESLNYDFMQEPLQSGEVWVAFDHVARLKDALNAAPEDFVAFPTPSGPMGRGFMPVIVGLGIPADAPNPEAGAEAIEYLTRPDVQAAVLAELSFFPVVEGSDTSNLPAGVALEAEAVQKLLNSQDGIPALLPVGLGERGGEINAIFRSAYARIVDNGEDIASVLDDEGNNLQALLNETGAPCWDPDPASDGRPCVVEPAS